MPYQPRSYPLVDLPRGPDPLQSLSAMMSASSMIEQYGEQRKQRQQEQRATSAYNDAKGDPLKAADLLEAQGDFVSARGFRDNATQIHEQALAQASERITAHKTVYGKAEQLLKDVKPEFYPDLRPTLVELAAQVDPRLAQEIPEQYDQERVNGMLQFTRDGAATLDIQARALAKAADANKITDDAQARALKRRESLSELFSVATTPEAWQFTKEYAPAVGFSREEVALFGDFSPEATERAQQIGMTPAQRATDARAKVDDTRQADAAAETKRHNAAIEGIQRQREARLSRQERDGTTPTGRATAERWKASQLEALEKEFTEGNLEVADIRRRQLVIENSYRAQINLKPLGALPQEWGAGGAAPAAPAAATTSGQERVASLRRGAQPPAPAAVPSDVSSLLSAEPSGRYTLTDGSVWEKGADGAVTKVQ